MGDTQRLVKTYEMHVPASPERVFPLLCPVREREWLPYWECRMIHSASGLAEPECVFTTDLPGRGSMIWVVTRYQPPEAIQYTIFKPESHTWNLSIRVRPTEPGSSCLTWRHVFTGLTGAGNQYLKEYTDEHHRLHLQKIETCLVHFLETGKILQEEKMANKPAGGDA
jgi:hypothetical protein